MPWPLPRRFFIDVVLAVVVMVEVLMVLVVIFGMVFATQEALVEP